MPLQRMASALLLNGTACGVEGREHPDGEHYRSVNVTVAARVEGGSGLTTEFPAEGPALGT